MKRAIAVIALMASTITPAQGGEIAGTRVKGDVELNCAVKGVEIDGKNQVWSFCIEPIKPTPEYTTVQPYGFKPSPHEEPFPYQVQTFDVTPVVPVIVETSTVTTDTAIVLSDTATALTDTTTATSASTTFETLYAQVMALLTQILALIAKLGR